MLRWYFKYHFISLIVLFQLVKEQKGRITELSKSKQEQTAEYRVRMCITVWYSVSLYYCIIQKGRITELSKSKHEQTAEYRVRMCITVWYSVSLYHYIIQKGRITELSKSTAEYRVRMCITVSYSVLLYHTKGQDNRIIQVQTGTDGWIQGKNVYHCIIQLIMGQHGKDFFNVSIIVSLLTWKGCHKFFYQCNTLSCVHRKVLLHHRHSNILYPKTIL